MSAKNNSHRSSRTATFVGSMALLALAALLLLNRQFIMDQVAVWRYTPSSTIQSITTTAGLSNKGVFYFYATHPEVAAASQFNQGCPRQEPSSPILGCYTGNRIYIYDVTNPQLYGVEEVTAAHEMLHAAWDRLSQSEKDRLAVLLQAEYKKNANGELAERMAYYQRNEPGQVVNELHSILPTEVTQLSPELETYYAQYFQDRQKVVTLHATYSSVLRDLKERADMLYNNVRALTEEINAASAEYAEQAAALSSSIETFNQQAQNNTFTSQQQFSAQRAALVARSNAVATERDAINAKIATYNQTYDQYQNVARDLDTLNKSLDSIGTLPDVPVLE